MRQRSLSSDLCPGCKKEKIDGPGLCQDCSIALRLGRMMQTDSKAFKMSRYAVPDINNLFWQPVPTPGCYSTEAQGLFSKAFNELLHSLATVHPGLGVTNEPYILGEDRKVVGFLTSVATMRDDHALFLRRLFDAVEIAVKNANKRGYDKGSNLIARIALGEITVSELNELSRP